MICFELSTAPALVGAACRVTTNKTGMMAPNHDKDTDDHRRFEMPKCDAARPSSGRRLGFAVLRAARAELLDMRKR